MSLCVCHRELESWVHDMQTLIGAVEVARDVASAEAALQRHRERKVSHELLTHIETQSSSTTQHTTNPKTVVILTYMYVMCMYWTLSEIVHFRETHAHMV